MTKDDLGDDKGGWSSIAEDSRDDQIFLSSLLARNEGKSSVSSRVHVLAAIPAPHGLHVVTRSSHHQSDIPS